MLFSSLIAFCSFASLALASPIPETENTLEKRQSFSGRATFYDVGLGACGEYNVESDYIVALNSAQYGGGYPGPNCGKSITISYGGKTAQAKIMDQCPSCGYGDLDLSRSLFNYFSDPGAGVFQMSWSFNGGGGGGQAPAPTTQKPKTSTKPAWTPPPTSTWVAPTSTYTPPTSTWTPPVESSSTPTPTSNTPNAAPASITESASDSPSASASSSMDPFVVPVNATVSGTVISVPLPTYALPMGNLVLLNQAITNLGAIVVIGAQE